VAAHARRSLAGALAGFCDMRTSVVAVAISLAVIACAVEPMAPPSLASRHTSEAPPPPPDIRDDPACKLFRWPLPPSVASEILERTETFADTGIYIGGEPPPQMAAFNVLLDQPDAVRWFDEIARYGSTVGRLYALCAFQVLDTQEASRLASQLRMLPGDVYTQFGCVGGDQGIAELVDAMERDLCGKWFRDARDRTFQYFGGETDLCTRPKRSASVEEPANNRLKLAARGRSAADARLRTRAAA
jgi:hypothetical protein